MRLSVRSFAWCLMLVASSLPRGVARTQPAQPQLPRAPIARGFPASADVTMRIYIPAGRLRLSVWARDSIHVRGTLGDAAAFFGGGSRTHVKLGVEPKVTGDTRLPEVDWEVSVPRGARVWVKMIDGEIDATGTTGELELYTVRGQITVRDVAGVTSIESIDAAVTVRRARGDLRVRGSRGAVVLDDVKGTVSVATVSGPVSLTGVVADGRVETIGGGIAFTGGSLGGAMLELQSHAGAITLSLDAKRAPLLDLSSRAGPVQGSQVVGAKAHGQLVARSFKGRISVRATPVTP